jgi:hypothetical protein
MDLEIVPADGQWQKEQLARILPELPAPGAGYWALAKAVVRALGYLGSDDALREIRKRVSAGPFTYDFIRQNTWPWKSGTAMETPTKPVKVALKSGCPQKVPATSSKSSAFIRPAIRKRTKVNRLLRFAAQA